MFRGVKIPKIESLKVAIFKERTKMERVAIFKKWREYDAT